MIVCQRVQGTQGHADRVHRTSCASQGRCECKQSSQQEEGHAAKCYEALLLMQQPQHAALLIEGRLTPRMRAKLAHAAGGMKDNVELSLPDFKNFVPRDAREFNGDQGSVPGFELVPPEVLGTEVYKSFAHGYLKVFQAIDIILQVGRDLPTPTRLWFIMILLY